MGKEKRIGSSSPPFPPGVEGEGGKRRKGSVYHLSEKVLRGGKKEIVHVP